MGTWVRYAVAPKIETTFLAVFDTTFLPNCCLPIVEKAAAEDENAIAIIVAEGTDSFMALLSLDVQNCLA